ncbi:hypothetical protein [Nostoc sp. 'Peltigera malacea cyanobiont' DB3992]|uniref:hypothetical protein n=1 Tax=Nostoc sp. 'Peltigera malacea cyanobiont' DB3992 TaxID=1206980 RepID=UPI0015D50452|nr:hypothetical protein [Nostoc sp. 'Peltigera malacea cyanobiont' DB3992]
MTQISQPRRTRILPASTLVSEEVHQRQEQRDALAVRCRAVFERLRPTLIETYYNWHIAIDPETERYLISGHRGSTYCATHVYCPATWFENSRTAD